MNHTRVVTHFVSQPAPTIKRLAPHIYFNVSINAIAILALSDSTQMENVFCKDFVPEFKNRKLEISCNHDF
jgi:hypothetical protein